MTDTAPGTELAPRDPAALMLSDDEIRRTFRVAEAMALSGMWKDIRRAEAAFAKMVVGRDLGLSPAQSMQGIHIVEGGIQMHYAMLGQFVRAREGYDYRSGWLKVELAPRNTPLPEGAEPQMQHVAVWHDEEDPADVRPIVGAVVEFTVNGERRGISRFTLEDAEQAKLVKDKGAWKTAPRNMLLARAMSNGVKWFVPEVTQGMPVYIPGEIPERASVTAPVGEGGDEGTGIDLGPQVEKVIARAKELEHPWLANRAVIEIQVGNRAPGVVKEWVREAMGKLDQFETEKAETQAGNEDPTVAVADSPAPTASAPPAPSAIDPQDEPEASSAPSTPEVEGTGEVEAPAPATEPGEETPQAQLLRSRLERLQALAETSEGDDREQVHAEMDSVEAQLRDLGVEP